MNRETYTDFLTDSGQEIYNEILAHLERNKLAQEADYFELGMLANSFDLYRRSAAICNSEGYTTVPSSTGYITVNPHFLVMKNEYANVLKHSAKFALNAGDRQRLFKGKLRKEKHTSVTDGLD